MMTMRARTPARPMKAPGLSTGREQGRPVRHEASVSGQNRVPVQARWIEVKREAMQECAKQTCDV